MATKTEPYQKYADRWHKEACHLYAKWLNAKRQGDEDAADIISVNILRLETTGSTTPKFAH